MISLESGTAAGGAVPAIAERLAPLVPAALPTSVARRNEAKAITLPGGQIFVFRDLIAKADQMAGVIAHEIGHVAHRQRIRAE